MSSYLEKLRLQIEKRLSVPVRFTKDPAHGMFTAMMSAPASVSLDDLPFVARVEFVEPVFLNFYLTSGWQQAAVREILQNELSMDAVVVFGDFAVQYAYNRICNQMELLASLGYVVDATKLELLTAPAELALMEQLALEPNLVLLAERFHTFFNLCPIRGEEVDLAGARMALMQACRIIFQLF